MAAKEEKEEQEHAQGIAKHDVFGMSIKAKDVDDEGDVRAIDTNLQVHLLMLFLLLNAQLPTPALLGPLLLLDLLLIYSKTVCLLTYKGSCLT